MLKLNANKALLVIPVLLFVLSAMLVSAAGPFYLRGKVDPAYMELMNSVSALTFHVPANTVHPGTTLHVLGAIVILFKWLFGTLVTGPWQPLDTAVLRDPESFLHAINVVLNILVGISVYYAAREIYRRSGSLLAALVLQGSVFLFPQTLFALFLVSPEPLLIACVFALTIPLTRYLCADEAARAVDSGKTARWACFLFGLGVVTKANLLPFASVLSLFKGYKQKLWFALSGMAAALLFLSPSLPRASQKVHNWFAPYSFHGEGPTDLPAADVLRDNVRTLYAYDPALFFLFFAYVVVLALTYFGKRDMGMGKPAGSRVQAVLLWGCVGILLHAVLTLLHFRPHYMVPSLVFVCFLNAVLVARYRFSRLRRLAQLGVLLLGSVAIYAGLVHSLEAVNMWSAGTRKDRQDMNVLSAQLNAMAGCLQVGYYTTSLPLYALYWGNTQAGGHHAEVLTELYPGVLAYDYMAGRFYSFNREDKSKDVIDALRKGRCVVAEGTAMAGGEMHLPDALRWDQVMVRGDEAIYSLTLETDSGVPAPATARFLRTDSTTKGSWKGTYGSQGLAIASETPMWPHYARVVWSNPNFGIWAASTNDERALQQSTATARAAAHWYGFTSISVEIDLRDGKTHQVALYAVDWDSDARVQEIEVLDSATAKVLDARSLADFKGGQYLVWSIAGRVIIRATRVGGANAVISGVFLD
jgi:hypothetical protein